jgi:hypothetical protein
MGQEHNRQYESNCQDYEKSQSFKIDNCLRDQHIVDNVQVGVLVDLVQQGLKDHEDVQVDYQEKNLFVVVKDQRDEDYDVTDHAHDDMRSLFKIRLLDFAFAEK